MLNISLLYVAGEMLHGHDHEATSHIYIYIHTILAYGPMLQWGLLLLISGGGIHFSLHHCRKDSISYKTFGPEPENWIPPDADMDLVLADLYVRFKQFCSRHKVTCSCSQFSRTKIHKTRVYEIPLYKCKASKSPLICAWLADICKDFQRAAPIDVKPHADRMAACTWGMAAYFVVVKKKYVFWG